MTQLESELNTLKSSVISMWLLVISQLEKAENAIKSMDTSIAREIKVNEKRVDAFELKLDLDCENILALFSPVAVDLRFVLACLKINYNLERIGDYANTIADLSGVFSKHFDKKLLKEARVNEMFNTSLNMLNCALHAFENENATLVRPIFQQDDELDKITSKSDDIIAEWIKKNPTKALDGLNLHSLIRKLERVGDQSKNIATEIIFHTEAKALRHTKRKQILEELDRESDKSPEN